MITALLTIIIVGLFYCSFCFFYLEDIYRTKNSKPLVLSALEALVQTIALFFALSVFVIIYYYG
jgi:hypothetical protein